MIDGEPMSLSKNVTEMRSVGELLISLTHPNVDLIEEYDIIPLKCRNVIIDGYSVIVNYSKSDYKKYFVESLQIQSAYSYFLPFNLVCKIAKSFLGVKCLAYADFIKNNKKIYCWTVRVKNGQPIQPNKKSRKTSYEGFEYGVSAKGTVNLFEK